MSIAESDALRVARDALVESERRYRRLFEGSRDAILVVSAGGAIVDANRAAVALLGREQAELTCLSLSDLVDARDASAFLKGGGEIRTDLHRKGGGRIHVWMTIAGSGFDDRGDAVVIRDVTEMLSLERQVQQAQKMEAIGRLAGGVAHDFNNLLTAITGYSELLLINLPPDDPNIEGVREILRAAESAHRLTAQLVTVSRQKPASRAVVDVNAVIAETVGILKRTLGEDVAVVMDLDPALKPVLTDRAHVEQIVLNLAVNARDAMPDGGRLTLTTSMRRTAAADAQGHAGTGDRVRISVGDTGCGIPEAIQTRVFEPFFTTKGAAGTGLGLATVYGIVKQNGGDIRFESTPGAGTTFTIDLPASEQALVVPHGSAVAPRCVTGSRKVLLVEDDPQVRSLVELVLRRAGHEVTTAPGPREALALIHEQPTVDMLVTDVVMPDMNGYDLAERLRVSSPALRCVFMSGFADNESSSKRAGVFVAKPFTMQSLTDAVRRAAA